MPKIQVGKRSVSYTLAIGLILSCASGSLSYAQNSFEGNAQNQQSQLIEAFDAWMIRAYEGDRDAQFKVALMFSDGTGTTKDIEQAVYWYIQAARQGLASAQYNLGHKYLSGKGIIKDPVKAVNWWRKAAEQEHELAQFNVARAYYSGIGVNKDEESAKYWFQRAAANDESRSRKILTDVFNVPNNQIGTFENMPAPTTVSASNAVETVEAYVEPVAVAAEPGVISVSEPFFDTVSRPKEQVGTEISSTVIIYNKPNNDAPIITQTDVALLKVIKKTKNWAQIRSNNGLPVWVFKTFAKIDGDTAVITGDNVNTRATPFVARGSVVGRLFKGNTVTVLEEREEWVRVQSPNKFSAWVKRLDYAKAKGTDNSYVAAKESAQDSSISKTVETSAATTPKTIVSAKPIKTNKIASSARSNVKVTDTYSFKDGTNDNEWLYSQPEESFTLQLASFSEDEILKLYIKRNKLDTDSNARQFISNRNNIEWKYLLYGSFDTHEAANAVKNKKGFKKAWVRNIGMIRRNRCVAWKTTLPTPKELKTYCQN